MSDLHARLRRLELELLRSFESGTLDHQAAASALAELEQLATLRAQGVLHFDDNVGVAIGLCTSALVFILHCALQLEHDAAHRGRCTHVHSDAGASVSWGQRCTLRAGHFGSHAFGSLLPKQCEHRVTQRCRLLFGHDGEHVIDHQDGEGDPDG